MQAACSAYAFFGFGSIMLLFFNVCFTAGGIYDPFEGDTCGESSQPLSAAWFSVCCLSLRTHIDIKHLLFSLTHTLTITFTCCYEVINGIQNLKIYSHADSLIFFAHTHLSLCSKDAIDRSRCVRIGGCLAVLVKNWCAVAAIVISLLGWQASGSASMNWGQGDCPAGGTVATKVDDVNSRFNDAAIGTGINILVELLLVEVYMFANVHRIIKKRREEAASETPGFA